MVIFESTSEQSKIVLLSGLTPYARRTKEFSKLCTAKIIFKRDLKPKTGPELGVKVPFLGFKVPFEISFFRTKF